MSTPENVNDDRRRNGAAGPECEYAGDAREPHPSDDAAAAPGHDPGASGIPPGHDPTGEDPPAAPTNDAGSATPPLPEACPPEVAVFLRQVFADGDCVLIRPIEIWTEPGGKRAARTIYKRTIYPRIGTPEPGRWSRLLRTAEEEKANLFFGVCPRFGGKQRYDLAWQIRVVRVLWADLDFCTVDEALARCQTHGVPPPSAVVHSGHGVHLYWFLAEPYLIDDAGGPPPVYTEFVDQGPGKKKRSRRYLLGDDSQKVYKLPTLSPKGRHAQQVLAGLAAKLGGDHTQDLSRLLRLPGTLNRKDQRNGRTPVPCELAECHQDRRYPFADFERFAAAAPAAVKASELAKVRLPSGKKLTPTRLNHLADYVNACSLAEAGQRSQRDFALCCHCVREGYDKDAVRAEVQEVGKFGERGRDYFEHTWGKAEQAVRAQLYRRAKPRSTRPADPVTPSRAVPPGAPPSGWSAPTAPAQDASPTGTEAPDAPESGTDERPREKIEDPHRLARLWLRHCATGANGLCHLAYFREQFWRWRRTHWSRCPDADVRSEVNHFCKWRLDRDNAALVAAWSGKGEPPTVPPVTTALVGNVLAAISGDVLYPADTPQPTWRGDDPGPRNWLAAANGILDVDAFLTEAELDDVLRPHSPLWFSPVCLPYDFDPDADCPLWKAFLARNLGDDPDKARLLQQWAGYNLLPDVSYQRFLMMVGEGANGKSVACAALTALLGEDNVSSVPLEMFGDKFRLHGTLGKLANVVAEVGELDRMAEGQIKAFVTGDAMEFEQKFKHPFRARPTARLVLATNNPPSFSDKSDGIWRRLLLLPFTVQIPAGERVAGMDTPEYWQRAGEVSGLLNWALAGLYDLRRAGRFAEPNSCYEGKEKMRVDSNPARRFLDDFFEAGGGTDVIAARDAYAAYRAWCEEHGHRCLSDCSFGKEVARRFPNVQRIRPGRRGAPRPWLYLGLRHQSEGAASGAS